MKVEQEILSYGTSFLMHYELWNWQDLQAYKLSLKYYFEVFIILKGVP